MLLQSEVFALKFLSFKTSVNINPFFVNEIFEPGFELSVSRIQDAIYFSIIAMLKKSHFAIFVIHKFVQNTKNALEFHFYCREYVCKVNEWCLVVCLHREFRVSTQIMVRDYCIAKYKTFTA